MFFLQDNLHIAMQDPRRMDPRRLNSSAGPTSLPVGEGKESVPLQMDISTLSSKPLSVPAVTAGAGGSIHPTAVEHSQNKVTGSSIIRINDQPDCREDLLTVPKESLYPSKGKSSLDVPLSPCRVDERIRETRFSGSETNFDLDVVSVPYFDQHSPSSSVPDFDQHPPTASNISSPEESYQELASVPSYVELTTEQSITVRKLAIERIIESNRHVYGFDCNKIRMALIARLIATVSASLVLLTCGFAVDSSYHFHHVESLFQILLQFFCLQA